jgi:RHH-type proline utilization regulon transcriptional repressor/proline dehydrogenase/delta 1-pyrroline-5-carboxylate dehydrogenase
MRSERRPQPQPDYLDWLRSRHLAALISLEAGRTLDDAVAEVREAVDFCRYYAQQARQHFGEPLTLPGPTGEVNRLSLHGRGVFVCISPWNFPLAIFTGQVAAALVAGNAVLAKPAEQTPLVAQRVVDAFYDSGLPDGLLHLVPGPGGMIGQQLVSDPRTAGVAFTGSTETARIINQTLAHRDAPIATLIAETGGQNVMLVDSTALAEQVVDDVVASAFKSAGQRCSALRVLYIQDEVAPRIIEMIAGAMAELVIGEPWKADVDIGPVIDAAALARLNDHTEQYVAQTLAVCSLPDGLNGYYFAPRMLELENISVLEGEIFGPVLHVIKYKANDILKVIDEINATGYGLTLGIHTRLDRFAARVFRSVRVGNTYVNRDMVGAVVGVNPFGGEGLSGTGPKAGGPHYLFRFATERTWTDNRVAQGGNTELFNLNR